MRGKSITIKDVAKIAGVSVQTVSRVLNEKTDVAEDTRQTVKEVIHRLGYRPNPIARSMKGQTLTLGCISPNLPLQEYARILQAMQTEAMRQGFLIFSGTGETENDLVRWIDELINRRVDGLLVVKPNDTGSSRYLLPLIQQNVPVVYIENSPNKEEIPAVLINHELGGYLATQHLINLNHEKIVMIEGLANEESTRDILSGYIKALKQQGLEADSNLILRGERTAESGYQKISQLLAERINFSAVFAQNDQMAMGAIHAIKHAGLRVPMDISVVGYGNTSHCSYFDPPLTTIDQPLEQMGQKGVQLLIEKISSGRSQNQIIRLDPVLIERGSCAALKV